MVGLSERTLELERPVVLEHGGLDNDLAGSGEGHDRESLLLEDGAMTQRPLYF